MIFGVFQLVAIGNFSKLKSIVDIALTKALRARPPEVAYLATKQPRAACVSTWLGE